MTEEELQDKLKHHDWWYMMSDSSRVFNKGEAADKQLVALVRRYPEQQRAKQLWEQYAPEGRAFPGVK